MRYGFLCLLLLTIPAALPAQGGFAATFRLDGDIRRPATLDRTALELLPAAELTRGEGADSVRYRGVELWTLLTQAEIVVDTARKSDLLRHVVLVTASDGYQVAFSLGELHPTFGNGRVLVAWEREGKPLAPERGMAQLLVPNDVRRGRSLHQIARITVLDPERPAP